MQAYSFVPIGKIHSCFTEKFGIPRQPRLIPQAKAVLEMLNPYAQSEAFRGLEHFSHLWILFIFHQLPTKPWKPTVRPPRLGGNRRMGVFATRSGFRPNPIGQSAVILEKIETTKGAMRLHLAGVDLLDGTPVIDIKPYLPYTDTIANAQGGYADQAPAPKFDVMFSAQARTICQRLEIDGYPDLEALVTAVLAQDPRPAYAQTQKSRPHGLRLWNLNIRFRIEQEAVVVETIRPLSE